MGWFNSTKPKGFHHTYIYIDERREAVRRLRQSRVEGEDDTHVASGKKMATPRTPLFSSPAQRHMAQRSSISMFVAIIVPLLILFLVFTMCMLLF